MTHGSDSQFKLHLVPQLMLCHLVGLCLFEPVTVAVQQIPSVKSSRIKLRLADALPLLSNVTLLLTVPHLLLVHQNEAFDH
ncbi:hypothetical protein N657DRAFT_322380 [Parathielavia appendiculata]|uniref:Uncharacterized protein n=1 Tax=Parathielavia appendiculata TaxID=2587402 RepID=A0AAN6YZ69_9PEZI|nr:hypothetical protein N657DRAFT_322380 [Parathielavia appendiculata]